MSDHDALLRAICADPDDDLPRLVFADWLEENGRPDHAAFVRAQVELARTPAWEPFAVRCRHHRSEWADGGPWRDTLPPLAASGIEWHPSAFRRGFGWRVNVGSLVSWEATAPRLFGLAPVGELDLNTAATLDDWRRFAAADWVAFLRVVHLGFRPSEPLLALGGSAAGITDVHFRRASSPGMPETVEALVQSPLGRSVRGLHFQVGDHPILEPLIDALASGGDEVRLERLTLDRMELTGPLLGRLLRGPAACHLVELNLRGNTRLGLLAVGVALPPGLHTLGLTETGFPGPDLSRLVGSERAVSLRRLDLSRNPGSGPRWVAALARSPYLAGLRSLNLRGCRLAMSELHHLTRAAFWPNLVELDLRENPISASVPHLLDVPPPAELVALLLDGSRLAAPARADLRRHYGDRVRFHFPRVPG